MKTIKNNFDILYCYNCYTYGHSINDCLKPIVSYGIIPFNIYNKNLYDFFISKYKFNNNTQLKNICISKYNLKNIIANNNYYLDHYNNQIINNIKFLLIKKNYTCFYIYLIRGLYNIDIENIILLINSLTIEEYNKIINNDFDVLIDEICKIDNEILYENVKYKFNILKNYIIPQAAHKININKNFNITNGFYKKIIDISDNNLDTLSKKFKMITGLSNDDYDILDRLYPLIEYKFINNKVQYKNIYYIAIVKNKKLNNNINMNLYSFDKILDNSSESIISIIENIKTFLIYNTRYFEKYFYKH